MKKANVVLMSSLAFLSLGLVSTSVFASQKNVSLVVNADNVSSYYSSIDDSLMGTDLLNALNTLNKSKRTRTVGYDNMRYFSVKSDADPNGSGKILGFYDNALVGPNWDSGNTWNREHVWPNIRGGSRVEGDAHMTRPASTATNSDRGSKGYGVDSYDPGKYVAYYRGSASRIIFYAAIADLNLDLVDDPLNYNGAGSYPDCMGSLSDMLKWNLEYQPSDTSFTGADDIARRAELNRNDVIQNDSEGQGNRNPFIDHPEYACRIWGNRNSKTKEICGYNVANSITLTPHERSVRVGKTITIQYEIDPKDLTPTPTVEWESSDSTIASVTEDGQITALKAGDTTIKATINGTSLSDTCLLHVLSEEGGAPAAKSGCGGNIATTSTILAILSSIGIATLLIRKYKKYE